MHWEEEFALEVGAPGAYDYGPERCSWLTHHLTNWMGDDGFLRNAKCKIRRHNPEGDLLFIKGRVKRKFVEDGRHLVEIEQEGAQPGPRAIGRGFRHRGTSVARLIMGALDGVRVVDLSRVLAGPLCTQMLADHGADVIKVEPPMGDETRLFGPPFDASGDAAYFSAVNRGKRALSLDLASPEGRAVLEKLLERADVLVENFLPGTMDTVGPRLRRSSRRAIRGSSMPRSRASAPTARSADLPGYDAVLQAMCGLMSVNGVRGVRTDAPRRAHRRSSHRLRRDDRHPDGAVRARSHGRRPARREPRCSMPD